MEKRRSYEKRGIMRDIKKVKRIIVKVGSTSLCNHQGVIEKEKILTLVLQISKLVRQGYTVVLVTSGAIDRKSVV